MRAVQRLTQLLVVLTTFTLPVSTTVSNVLFPLAALLSLFSDPLHEKWLRIRRNPVTLSMLGFFLVYLIGTTYTIAAPTNVLHQLSKASCFLFAALLIPALQDSRWRRYAIDAFLVSMVITLILSYIKFFFLHELFHTRFDYSSVFKDHIIQNFFMALSTFIFAYRWIHKYRFRWIYAILTVAATYNVFFMSMGRTGYFIFASLLVFTFAYYLRWRGFVYAITAVALLFSLASLNGGFRHRMASASSNIHQYLKGHGYNSLGIRIQSIQNATDLYRQKPLIGHGTGSYAAAYAKLPQEKIKTTGVMVNSYNAYLNIAVQFGIPGITLLLLMFFMQWRYSFQLPKDMRYLVQTLLIGMMIGCIANPWLEDTTELHLYVIFIAVSFAGLSLNYATEKKHTQKQDALISD